MDTATSLNKSHKPIIKVGLDHLDFELVCRELQNSYWALGRSKEIILKHGGQVLVETKDRTCCIRFILPCQEKEPLK